MKRSTDRILTTHVGSLIRPPALVEFLRAQQERKPVDQAAFAACLTSSVAEVVHEVSAQPGLVAIRWAQCAQPLRLVKRAASA